MHSKLVFISLHGAVMIHDKIVPPNVCVLGFWPDANSLSCALYTFGGFWIFVMYYYSIYTLRIHFAHNIRCSLFQILQISSPVRILSRRADEISYIILHKLQMRWRVMRDQWLLQMDFTYFSSTIRLLFLDFLFEITKYIRIHRFYGSTMQNALQCAVLFVIICTSLCASHYFSHYRRIITLLIMHVCRNLWRIGKMNMCGVVDICRILWMRAIDGISLGIANGRKLAANIQLQLTDNRFFSVTRTKFTTFAIIFALIQRALFSVIQENVQKCSSKLQQWHSSKLFFRGIRRFNLYDCFCIQKHVWFR